MDHLIEREVPVLDLTRGKVDRPPFLMQLYANKFDDRFLTYPEVLDNPQIESVNELYQQVKLYVDSLEPNALRDGVPQQVVDALRSLGVYGAAISSDFGGMGLTVTEQCRLFEAFASQPALGAAMLAHSSTGLTALTSYGRKDVLARYLPRLANGEWQAAFAMHEPQSGTDAAMVTTTLSLAGDEIHYRLNGRKTYVTNGERADLFTVICRRDPLNEQDSNASSVLCAVLVERNQPGVKVTPADELSGLHGCGLSTVTFENAYVAKDCLLGRPGDGVKIGIETLNRSRCPLSAVALGTARQAFDDAVTHAIHTRRHQRNLNEFHIIKRKTAEMTLDVYAAESMIYLTTAVADVVNDPNFVLEAAATRLWSLAAARRVVATTVDIQGVAGLRSDGRTARWLRDVQALGSFEATTDINHLLLAMTGIQYAGKSLAPSIFKLRDPLRNPLTAVRRMFDRQRDRNDDSRIAGELDQFIHPTLKAESETLEYVVKRLAYASQLVLEKFGAEAMEYTDVLRRLANVSTDVFALSAVLGRASRATCIGLLNADYELKLARLFAVDVRERVQSHVQEIEAGAFRRHPLVMDIADKVFFDKKYPAVHPITKNW